MAIMGDAVLVDVPAKAALYIKRRALEMNNKIVPLFKDSLLRGEIFPDMDCEECIRVNILACNEKGSFKLLRFAINTAEDKVFVAKTTKRVYSEPSSGIKLKNAVLDFIDSIDGKLPPISTVRVDLDVRSYLSVQYTNATREKNAFDLHICSYSNQIKEDYGCASAQSLAGVLATF